jgi:ABC-type glycerol-3-phosphate transport system permease component
MTDYPEQLAGDGRSFWQRGLSILPRAHRRPGFPLQMLAMLAISLSAIFPLYFMVAGAFRTQLDWARSEVGLPSVASFSAFRSVWEQATLGVYIRNSAIIATGTVVLSLIIAATAGYSFSHLRWRGQRAMYYFVIAWLAVPPIALLVPIYDEMNRLGLVNTYWSVILLYTALGTPFNVYLMASYLRGVSGDFIEAARMDGAGVHSIFIEVVLPLSRPPLATLAIFNFLFAWNEFIFALLLLQSDHVKTATVGVLQLQGRYSTTYPTLVAGLLIVSLPVIAIYVFFQRYLVRAIVAGGIK